MAIFTRLTLISGLCNHCIYLSAGASVISAARVRRRVAGSAANAANKSADRSDAGYDSISAAASSDEADGDDDEDGEEEEDDTEAAATQ